MEMYCILGGGGGEGASVLVQSPRCVQQNTWGFTCRLTTELCKGRIIGVYRIFNLFSLLHVGWVKIKKMESQKLEEIENWQLKRKKKKENEIDFEIDEMNKRSKKIKGND